eukprot:3273505-Prymnesium_polylepis.1
MRCTRGPVPHPGGGSCAYGRGSDREQFRKFRRTCPDSGEIDHLRAWLGRLLFMLLDNFCAATGARGRSTAGSAAD